MKIVLFGISLSLSPHINIQVLSHTGLSNISWTAASDLVSSLKLLN